MESSELVGLQDVEIILNGIIFTHFLVNILCNSEEIDYRKMTQKVINQHWFRQRLGAIRQQTITWFNVDSDILSPHVLTRLQSIKISISLSVILGHRELVLLRTRTKDGKLSHCIIFLLPIVLHNDILNHMIVIYTMCNHWSHICIMTH